MTTATTSRDRFGIYGGRYVPETLIKALDEVTEAYRAARADEAFLADLEGLYTSFVGRPTPLYHAERLGAEVGHPAVYLKREDLNHTGAHKINNTIGQALLARRMGKRRIIAETGAGQHGVATATGLRALRPRLCRLHGRGRRRTAGAQRLPDGASRRGGEAGGLRNAYAQGRHERSDPRLGHETSNPRTTSSAPWWDPTPSRGWFGTSSRSSAARRASSSWTWRAAYRLRSSPVWAVDRTRSGSSTTS